MILRRIVSISLRHKIFNFSKQGELQKRNKVKSSADFIPDINKPHEADAGIYSVDRVMHKEQVSQELKQRMEDLRKRHEMLRRQLGQKINIPFLLCGVNRKTYYQNFSYMPDRIMGYYRIHPSTITDYLLKIYKASLYAMIDGNTSFMDQYWQEGFKNKALQALEKAKTDGHQIKLTQQKNFLEEARQSCKIVDSVLVRGLSTQRSQNQPPSSFHKYAEDKQFGLITYTPLYLTGDNEKFQNPESNKTVYKGYQKMILRTLLLIKTPLRLYVPNMPVPAQLNTMQHLVVIQNQMLAPPHLQSRYKLETLVEWLGKYRFGNWRVVDIDNFMKGNSPFRLHQNNQQEIQEIFQNTVMDKSYYCNIRQF